MHRKNFAIPEHSSVEKRKGRFRFHKSLKYWIALIYAALALLANLFILGDPLYIGEPCAWGPFYVVFMSLIILSLLFMIKWPKAFWLCVLFIIPIIIVFPVPWYEVGLIGFWMYLLWRDGLRKRPQENRANSD